MVALPSPPSFPLSPNPLPAFNRPSSTHPSFASRASASTAGGSVVALEVSVAFDVVEEDGCCEAAAWGFDAAKEPPEERESAARESEVTRPVGSCVGAVEVTFVPWEDILKGGLWLF